MLPFFVTRIWTPVAVSAVSAMERATKKSAHVVVPHLDFMSMSFSCYIFSDWI